MGRKFEVFFICFFYALTTKVQPLAKRPSSPAAPQLWSSQGRRAPQIQRACQLATQQESYSEKRLACRSESRFYISGDRCRGKRVQSSSNIAPGPVTDLFLVPLVKLKATHEKPKRWQSSTARETSKPITYLDPRCSIAIFTIISSTWLVVRVTILFWTMAVESSMPLAVPLLRAWE